MTPITTMEVDAFSKAEETTSVVVEAEVKIVQTSCLQKQKVDTALVEEQDAVTEVVLKKFLTLTQTTVKNWFQVRMKKPKQKSFWLPLL